MVKTILEKVLFSLNIDKDFSLLGKIYGRDRLYLGKLTGLQKTKFVSHLRCPLKSLLFRNKQQR